MIRFPAAAVALVLSAVPVAVAPVPPVAATAGVGLLLAGLAVGARWRWPATAAACVFLADYAAALWLAEARVDVLRATGFGLALLLLLETVDLTCRARRAAVNPAVLRAELARWSGFGAAALGAAVLAMTVGGALATAMPPMLSPVLAAGAALAIAVTLALVIARR